MNHCIQQEWGRWLPFRKKRRIILTTQFRHRQENLYLSSIQVWILLTCLLFLLFYVNHNQLSPFQMFNTSNVFKFQNPFYLFHPSCPTSVLIFKGEIFFFHAFFFISARVNSSRQLAPRVPLNLFIFVSFFFVCPPFSFTVQSSHIHAHTS